MEQGGLVVLWLQGHRVDRGRHRIIHRFPSSEVQRQPPQRHTEGVPDSFEAGVCFCMSCVLLVCVLLTLFLGSV